LTFLLLASALTSLVLAQAPPKPGASPAAAPAAVEPAPPLITTPTDGFGPGLKAWLDASKAQDQDAAAKALAGLQRMRAERNLTSVDDLAGALFGRAEARAGEGTPADSLDAVKAAISFAPDNAAYRVRKAEIEGKAADAWSALDLALANPLEEGRVLSVVYL
jgi:hypothetical protein